MKAIYEFDETFQETLTSLRYKLDSPSNAHILQTAVALLKTIQPYVDDGVLFIRDREFVEYAIRIIEK